MEICLWGDRGCWHQMVGWCLHSCWCQGSYCADGFGHRWVKREFVERWLGTVCFLQWWECSEWSFETPALCSFAFLERFHTQLWIHTIACCDQKFAKHKKRRSVGRFLLWVGQCIFWFFVVDWNLALGKRRQFYDLQFAPRILIWWRRAPGCWYCCLWQLGATTDKIILSCLFPSDLCTSLLACGKGIQDFCLLFSYCLGPWRRCRRGLRTFVHLHR